MTKREIATLACRVLAIQTFAVGLTSVRLPPSLLAPAGAPPMPPLLMFAYLLPPLLMFSFSLALWFAAGPAGRWMTAGFDPQEKEPLADAGAVRTVAFTVIGLFLAVTSLPSIAQGIAGLFIAAGNPQMRAAIGQNIAFSACGSGVQLVLGLLMTFNAAGLSRWTAGAPPKA
jgi:hypothetical protein